MGKKSNAHRQPAGSPTMSQRWGLLSIAMLMLVALVILLCRQESGTPAKCEAELIPLRQMQQYKAIQAAPDSMTAPQVSPTTKMPKKVKTHKTKKRSKAPKAGAQQGPTRKINEETLTSQ